MGPWVLINARWYKSALPPKADIRRIMLFNSADAIAALISNVIIVMLPRFAPHALQRLLRPISGIGGGHQHFNSCLATICIRPVALSFCHVLKVSERQFRRCPSKKTASTTGIEKR